MLSKERTTKQVFLWHLLVVSLFMLLWDRVEDKMSKLTQIYRTILKNYGSPAPDRWRSELLDFPAVPRQRHLAAGMLARTEGRHTQECKLMSKQCSDCKLLKLFLS